MSLKTTLPPGGIEITPDEAQALRDRALKRLRDKRYADWYLGRALYEVRHSYVVLQHGVIPVVEHWGYDTWCEYADDELHLDRRDAERHYLVYKTFGVQLNEYFDPESDLLNHSKMRLLCRVVDRTNVTGWISRARVMNVRQLERACAAAYNGEDPAELFHYGLEVTADEAAVLDRALAITRQRWGRRRKGASLVEALKEWLESIEPPRPRTQSPLDRSHSST